MRLAEAGSDHALGNVLGIAVRAQVDELGGKVGVGRRGRRVEAEGNRAGNFDSVVQRLPGVHQHVLPLLNLGLIQHAHSHAQGAPAPGRHRVVRVVHIAVLGLFVRHRARQAAVAVEAVGLPAAVQIQLGVARARQRPLVFVPPAVVAHHKQPNRRLIGHAVVYALEEIIEPAQLHVV